MQNLTLTSNPNSITLQHCLPQVTPPVL